LRIDGKKHIEYVLWHPRMSIDHAKISYIHRGAPGNLKTIKGCFVDQIGKWVLDTKRWNSNPFHRIIKIEYNDKPLYIR
jgi:uncharacterized protein (UPF0248 family)